MSNIDNGMNQGSSSFEGMSFEGMAEQHQDLGGAPGGVRGMAAKAGEKIMDTAEKQKAVGADYVDGIAEAVRRAAGEFEGQAPQAAQYIRYAADQMESMSDSFRRRDIAQMMQDVQSFARRQPTAFLGIGFLAGFAAVRFLRSGSSGSSMSSSGTWQDREPMDTGRYGASSSEGSWQGGSSMGGSSANEDRFGSSGSGAMPGARL